MSYESRLCETPVHPRLVSFVETAKKETKDLPLNVSKTYVCPLCNGKAVAYTDIKDQIHAKCNDCTESVNYDADTDDKIFEKKTIVRAWYTREVNNRDYSELICIFADGNKKTFHFHISNPMPREYVVEGLTWEELRGVVIGMWRMALGECIKLK